MTTLSKSTQAILSSNAAAQAKTEKELAKLGEEITTEIAALLHESVNTNHVAMPNLADFIQPPNSIIRLAAKAAADVFMAFERGYRMGE